MAGWRGPSEPGEFPTLGWQVGEWIEQWCVIPDGENAGNPYELTAEMWRWLVFYYRIDPTTGRFFYSRGGQLVRPQKWGKGPLSAAQILAEVLGPVLFDYWDPDGEPVAKAWATPWIQVAAMSEEQTGNVYKALVPMIQLGPLDDIFPAGDVGLTRINLPGGGRIEPVTSAATSRLGQRVTFAVQDETHQWLPDNGGRKLADAQRRNIAGMGGRWIETTNAWNPAEESVAKVTNEHPIGVLVDYPTPPKASVHNKRERRRALRKLYGECHWIDLDRIDDEMTALIEQGDPDQAERFYLNRCTQAGSTAFDLKRWGFLAVDEPRKISKAKDLIVLGIDGARSDDSLAVVACTVNDPYMWPVGVWERPAGAGPDYEHPLAEVKEAIRDLESRHHIWRAYCDPQYIETLVDELAGTYGEKRYVRWRTDRSRVMAHAVRKFASAIRSADFAHSGDLTLTQHIRNSRRRPARVLDDKGRPMWTIAKDGMNSPRKIDAAVASILAWEARNDAVAAGATVPKKRAAAGFGGRR